jgi:hypothetical protein
MTHKEGLLSTKEIKNAAEELKMRASSAED